MLVFMQRVITEETEWFSNSIWPKNFLFLGSVCAEVGRNRGVWGQTGGGAKGERERIFSRFHTQCGA